MILNSPYITGSITVTGNANIQGELTVTGSLSGIASTASFALTLDGTGSVGFATTGAFTATSGSASSRLTQIEQVYATTGSNSFRATQSITGSLTVTGQIIAQTLNVQQVTSSIVYSSGSNVFGCDINSRQTFTGSFYQTGSVACFSNTIKIGADATITSRNINLAGFPTSICFGNGQSIYDNAGGGLAINGQSSIQFITCATASLNLSSAGYLGIGTTTPCRELHAKGEILFQSRNATPTNNSMYRFIPRSTEGAFEFQLMSDNTSCENTVWVVCRNAQTVTSFSILNSNVGIGTCAPESKLHMYNANNPLSIKIQRTTVPVFLSDVQLAGTTAGAVWSHNLENTSNGSVSWGGFGNTSYAGSAIILQSDTGNSFITLHTAASNNTVPTERLRIGGAGTFGFNCSGVAARTMVVKGVSGCYIVAEFIESAGVHSIEIYPNKSSTNHISSDYMSGGTFLPLSLSGRECTTDLVLGTNGNVGIGTSPGTTGKLTVYDLGCVVSLGLTNFACQAKGVDVYNSQSGTTDNVIGYWISTGPHKAGIGSGRTNAASSWEVDLRFYTHPTTIGSLDATCENMRLYGDGSLVTRGGTSSPGLYSDINLKQNISRISSALNKIECINGYTFDWKDNAPSRSNPNLLNIIHDAGLIAQEVEEIMPDIVRNNDLSCIKMLNYNGITALLVEGIKEQQCTINALKTCLGIS